MIDAQQPNATESQTAPPPPGTASPVVPTIEQAASAPAIAKPVARKVAPKLASKAAGKSTSPRAKTTPKTATNKPLAEPGAQAQAKAAPPANPKQAVKPSAKAIAKPVSKPSTPQVVKVSAKAEKVKAKLIRDSFTMPREDWDLIQALKERALGFKRPTKKSELLRAGLQVLVGLSDAKLQAALERLTPLKAGRPKGSGK